MAIFSTLFTYALFGAIGFEYGRLRKVKTSPLEWVLLSLFVLLSLVGVRLIDFILIGILDFQIRVYHVLLALSAGALIGLLSKHIKAPQTDSAQHVQQVRP